jgi:hypothetical protein
MDATWLFVIGILLVLFASAIGALRRIADATERSTALLETLVSASRDKVQP